MFNIRKGKIKDFKQLNTKWAWLSHPNILVDCIEKIKNGRQEFLVVLNEDKIIGEVHIHWLDNDHDQADGQKRAYLGALRIDPVFQSQGLGTQLMERALERVKENGRSEVSIAAYKDEPETQEWYKRLGFTKVIKENTEQLEADEPRQIILFLKYLYG